MKLWHLAPVALVAVAGTASAEGFYIVGQLGHSKTTLDSTHFDSSLAAEPVTGLTSEHSGSSNQFRIQGGYRFSGNWAAEAGYIDFGKSKYEASFASGNAAGSLKAGGVDAAGLFLLPLSQRVALFAKGGVVFASVKSSLATSGLSAPPAGNASVHVVRPLFGVGATFSLVPALDLRLDLDHVSRLGKSQTGTMGSTMLSIGAVYGF